MTTTRTRIESIVISFFIIMLSSAARAGDVSFSFNIPTIPDPPKIVSVTNSSVIPGEAVSVYANIVGQIQKSVCCNGVCTHQCEPNCDFSACGMTDFYGDTDTRIVPNPTCIPNSVNSEPGTSACQVSSLSNPRLFYYFQENPATVKSVGMTYDAATGNFKGEIPKADMALYSPGDTVAYYIVASDNRGNVVSQVPSVNDIPCSSALVSSWSSSLSTPSIDNCKAMNSYEQCGKWKSGTPTCGTGYSQNDPTGDTCGENGSVTGGQSQLDVIGISAGIGTGFTEIPSQKVVCAKIGLAANAPDVGSNATPISAYVMIFLNPDIVDPNPNDIHMTNATAITYAPGIAGIEPNLVKVLWDGECVTNPNTPDILGCKLVTGGDNEKKLKISSGSSALLFIAQDSLSNGKNISGSNSKTVKALIGTGAIQLDGGTPFWLVDMTSGFSISQDNQDFIIPINPEPPAPPIVAEVQTCVNGDGSSYDSGECAKSLSEPTSNICRLSVKPSPDASSSNEYKVYRATTNSVTAAVAGGVITTITNNLDSTNIVDDTISVFEGQTYYYFFSAYRSNGELETAASKMSTSKCTVEDWKAPSPTSTPVCATPAGNEAKCECKWTADTSVDPTLRRFRILRDGEDITPQVGLPAALGQNNYSYTDVDSALTQGQSYSYSVSTIDAGGNESSAVSSACVPQDLKSPDKVSDIATYNTPGETTLDAKIEWTGSPEEDLEFYNVYKCANATAETSCISFPGNWIKVNDSPIAHGGAGSPHERIALDVPATGDKLTEGNYCFWVQACDNCVTAGTCESSEPNCSIFDTLPAYRSCVDITDVIPPGAPATPQGVTATALPEGKKCELKWNKVTSHDDGRSFDDPNNPTNMELMYYAVMSAPFGEVISENPITTTPVGKVSKTGSPSFTHTGLTNGVVYQYYVFGVDSDKKFSPKPAAVTTCAPERTVAPDAPSNVAAAPANENTTCDISWDAVVDDDVISYSIHRCEGTAENCSSEDFPSDWGDNLGIPYSDITERELSDFDVELDSKTYTYCITAKEPSGNESGLLNGQTNAGLASNCAVCSVGTTPPPPPTNVSAAPYVTTGDNYGVKVTYANSTGYADNGNTGGHNIYYCPDIACAVKTKINTSLETADHSTSAYEKQTLGAGAGSYYFAVSYVSKSGVESALAISASSVTVAQQGGDITITISKKLVSRDIVECDSSDPECKTRVVKAVETPFTGAVIRVVNDSTGSAIKEMALNADGSVPEVKLNYATDVTPGVMYKVVLNIPAESFTGFAGECENQSSVETDGCDLNVVKPEAFASGDKKTGVARAISTTVGKGGDVGNANGDGMVNIFDLAAIKPAYNKNVDNQCYRVWADFNLDGNVNIFDLNILKENYNKSISLAPGESLDPTLVKDKYPYKGTDDACCETGTCQ